MRARPRGSGTGFNSGDTGTDRYPDGACLLKFAILGVVLIVAAGISAALLVPSSPISIRSDEPAAAKWLPLTVEGSLRLDIGAVCTSCSPNWDRAAAAPSACVPRSGYTNVPGAQVLLEADGKTLNVGELSPVGTIEGQYCVYEFRLTVPERHDFYKVTLQHRGDFTYSYDDLVNKAGTLTYTLGN